MQEPHACHTTIRLILCQDRQHKPVPGPSLFNPPELAERSMVGT
ncbi:hypothetical protein ACFONI_16200 [Aeromonas media]